MENKNFSVNIDAEAVKAQYEQEQKQTIQKTTFDEKNYLKARLTPNESTKTLTIRLLPFSPEGGSPFKKVFMHTVKVNKEVSQGGWKTFVCPTHNEKDGSVMGDGCPFCETASKARELKMQTQDEPTRKKYGDIEFMNRVKEMWVVRCIERGHEEDGVKFWLFSSSKKKDGVYDKIMNLANQRAASAARKGNNYSIFDLNNGMDLIVTLSKTADGKTSIQIIDEGMPSTLSDDYELGMTWINDPKKWHEVYTVKSYDYMTIIASGGIPIFNKELNTYVDKEEQEKVVKETREKELEENLSAPTKDFSEIAVKAETVEIINGNSIGDKPSSEEDDMDLPF